MTQPEKPAVDWAQVARVTSALMHIGGILETLDLAGFAASLRAARDAIPGTWEGCTPADAAERNRLRALLAVATQADNIVDEVHTAQAYWVEAVTLRKAEQEPEEYTLHGPAVASGKPGTVLQFPGAERLAAELEGRSHGPA